ncbi:methionyl-tRNA formyltransferase [Spiribacter sp. 1M153]|uniref:methionyl-tRNA formyltransferase n=1 Tax=Spiribacter roseus TaxID=1855875 RepID=UPI00349F6B03
MGAGERTPPRIVYAGTPDFAVPALEALVAAGYPIAAVYTQPDRPAGRGRRPRPSAVKTAALEHGLSVEQPERLDNADARARLAHHQPDVMIVAAYGLILPTSVLNIPTNGCVNIHASLLPRWRGAAPIQRAIEAGDPETGVCLMEMAAGLDTGPVIAARSTPISADDNAAQLHDRLADLGAQLLLECLDDWLDGRRPAHPQPEDGVTYAARISADEAWVDWQRPALETARRVRAFNAWPVARCAWGDARLRVWQAVALPADAAAAAPAPGTIVAVGADGIDVQTGEGLLRLQRVQAAGGRAQPVAEFLRGHPVHVGETLH